MMKKSKLYNLPPSILPETMMDHEIHVRTGFKTMKEFFFYIIVVCNGVCDKISERKSELTRFDEWVYYFERMNGKTTDW